MAEKKTIELEIKSNLDSAQQSVSGLKTQLRNAQAEVAILSDKFGATSKEAVNAAKKAAELRDRIGDAKALTDAFNPDAKFRALSGSLAGVAGGFSAVTGIMGALGTESKEVEQAILKVQSAMAIASGLQTLGESIDQFKILGSVISNTTIYQRALTIATATYTYVNAAATTGLKLLRGAMVSTGVGALVVGIGYLISKMGDASDATEKLTKRQESLNKQLENTKKLTDDAAKSIDYNTQIQLAKAKQRGASEKELLRIELDGYEARGKANNKEIQDIQKTQKNQLNLTKEQNKRIQELREENQNLQRQGNLAIANLDAELAVKQRENVKETNKEISVEEQKRIDEKKQRLDDEMQSAKDAIAILESLKPPETPAQKELREYEEKKAILLANNLDTKKLTEDFLISQANAEYVIYEEKLAATKELTDKELAAEQAVREAKRNALDTSLNILQQFAGKNKAVALGILAVQKGLAIGDVVVGAAKAIGLAKASMAPTPLNPPFLGPGVPNPSYLTNLKVGAASIIATKIGAATSIASILAAGISGAKSITGGGGGATDGGGGGGGTAPTAPAFNVVGASATNQIAQTIANQQQQPIKAYVVSNDVTTAQSLDRNIISSASIG
jgi:hypothetical protein